MVEFLQFLVSAVFGFFISRLIYRKWITEGKGKILALVSSIVIFIPVSLVTLAAVLAIYPKLQIMVAQGERKGQIELEQRIEAENREIDRQKRRAAYEAKEAIKDRSVMAGLICKDFVKGRLKSPSTADFPFFDKQVWKTDGQKYTVKSYVDAQNSFGAMIRNNWTCEVEYLGGEDSSLENWQLLNIVMQ